jgi:MFS family permease
MFLLYAVPGAWIPVLSLRLEEELGFTPMQTSWAYAAWAISAVVASLVAGQVADRWLALERCIAGGSALVGVLLLVMAALSEPLAVIGVCLAACLFLVPILTLGVTLCLTNLSNPEQQFGGVRLWGTVGWILAGLVLGLWLRLPVWYPELAAYLPEVSLGDSLRLAGLLALCLSVYALTLPHTPPLRRGRTWLAPLGAVHLLRDRPFAVFCLCSFLLHVTLPFSIQQLPLVLRQLGIAKEWVGLTATVAQWSEVVTLGLLAVVTTRLGMRNTLLVGALAWALGLTVFMIGQPAWLVIGSLLLNGIFITCFAVRGQVFVNQEAGQDIRASAQGLITMTNGTGLLLGNLLVGIVRHAVAGQFMPTFAVGVCIAFVAVTLLALGFVPRREETQPAPALWPRPVRVEKRAPEVIPAVAAVRQR